MTQTYRCAPADAATESAVLGATLLRAELYHEAARFINGRSLFFEKEHQALWRTVTDWYASHDTPPDYMTVANACEQVGLPLNYASDLYANACLPYNISYHLGTLLRLWKRRQARDRAAMLARYADADDIEGLEAAVEALRDDIRAGESGTPLPITKVADAGEMKSPLFASGPVPGGFGLIIGGDGIGKGWLTLDLLLSCATATAINVPSFACTARSLRCLYLCCEDDARVLRWRLDRISAAAGVDAQAWRQRERDGMITFATDIPPLFVQSGRDAPAPTETLTQIRAHIERHDTDLCVIDPLSACAVLQNENDNAALNAVAVALRRMAAETGCAVLLTHHTGKAGRYLTGDHQAARGGSALGGAARWVLTLTESADDRLNLVAAVAKNNYGPRVFDVKVRRNEDTGVLREVSGAELGRQKEQLVEAVIAYFAQERDAAITLNTIKLRNSPDAKAFVAALGARPGECLEAVQTAIRQGALTTEKRSKANRSGICEYVVFVDDNPGDTAEEEIPF